MHHLHLFANLWIFSGLVLHADILWDHSISMCSIFTCIHSIRHLWVYVPINPLEKAYHKKHTQGSIKSKYIPLRCHWMRLKIRIFKGEEEGTSLEMQKLSFQTWKKIHSGFGSKDPEFISFFTTLLINCRKGEIQSLWPKLCYHFRAMSSLYQLLSTKRIRTLILYIDTVSHFNLFHEYIWIKWTNIRETTAPSNNRKIVCVCTKLLNKMQNIFGAVFCCCCFGLNAFHINHYEVVVENRAC